MTKEKILSPKAIKLIVLLLVALLSMTIVTQYASSAGNHSGVLNELDEKKSTALSLTAGVAATSTAIAAVPTDATTPIAEQISELTSPLLLVVCAIYLEKFLLTTIGYVSFRFLIPIACVLFGIYVFLGTEKLKSLAFRLSVFAICIYLVIPTSVRITTLIEKTFHESISETYDVVNEISDEAEEASDSEDSNGFMDFLSGIGDEVGGLVDSAKNALSVFIDAIAVLIITTCVIPIVVIIAFFYLIKVLFGIDINLNINFKGAKNIFHKRKKIS